MAEPQNVTVVIANHNYSRWLPGCVDSAVKSDHRPLQVCVVDDGSTDDSVDVVSRRLKDPQPFKGPDGVEGIQGYWDAPDVPVLLVSCSPSRGPSAARNVAIRASWEWSDWFQILDADDEVYHRKITALIAAATALGDDVGFAYGDYDTLDEQGVLLRNYKEPFSRARLLGECVPHSGSLVAKRWLAKVGLFEEDLRCAEDYSLWLRLSEHSLGVHVPESLTLVRTGSHNSTSTVPSETWRTCWKRVADRTRERGVGLGRVRGG